MISINRINFTFTNKDNISINAYKWIPKDSDNIKGVVQIAHGMNEHILRYDYFAKELNRHGYLVYGHDHRGHGKTAANIDELGYISDNDGFIDMVEDMRLMTDIIREDNPDTDIILFGHSMGSFLSQRYVQIYGDLIDGLILSGSNGRPVPVLGLGIILSKLAMKIKGRRAKIEFFDDLTFYGYNKRIKPLRTKFDWLSRDIDVVDKYIEDPYCGNLFTVSFFHDLYLGLRRIHINDNMEGTPKNLPIYILAGEDDPVGYYGKGIVNLYNIYKDLGILNLSYKLYESGRHEMLNEINKDEVIGDVITWLTNNIKN